MNSTCRIVVIISYIALPTLAQAQLSGLGYPTRTRPYSGWTAIVKGDNNTVGMAGATVALPNSISAMESNPAGFAMNLGGLAAQINSFSLKDPDTNQGSNGTTEYQWGLGTSVPPWGYGITYYAPATEHIARSEVSVREFRASAARLLGERTSVGASIEMIKGIRKFDGTDQSSAHLGFQIGVLHKLDNHWVLGASYSPPADIGPDSNGSGVQTFGFNQTIKIPALISFGIGFMPNRFFKAGASIVMVGSTSDTALLIDQTKPYGQSLTVQPRLGASYILVEYDSVKVELAMGTYYEISRIDGQANRIHGTFGLDVNPYFVNTGIGTDMARGYSNWTVSVGFDIVRTVRFFGIIPKDTVPPYKGSFPPIFDVSADGLADGFTQGEEKSISPPSAEDVRNIVEGIPKRIEAKFSKPLTKSAPSGESITSLPKVKKRKHKTKAPESIKNLKPEDRQL